MEERKINGMSLFYEDTDIEAADLVHKTLENSIDIIKDLWGLDSPPHLRVYVMRSWFTFYLHATPWLQKPSFLITLPVMALRLRKLWPFAGGWHQPFFGGRRAVGVKPPDMLEAADTTIGEKVFVKEPDVQKRVQSVTCHEVTHAFSSHLKLPIWLNEGVSMLTVDRFFGKNTVRPDTLKVVEKFARKYGLNNRQRLSFRDPEAIIFHYVHGYWLTRYIEETKPGLLGSLFAEKIRGRKFNKRIADAYGQAGDAFWKEIDQEVIAHFEPLNQSNDLSRLL